jgi:phosphatidylinositol alpha-mannosyltransferase
MKIGLVTDSSLTIPGGVQEYVRGLHDSLRERGEDVQIITSGNAGNEDKDRHVTSLGRSVELSVLHWSGAASSVPLNWVSPARIREFLQSERFDVLHYAAPMSILGSQVLRLSKTASPNTTNVVAFLIYSETTPLAVKFASPVFYQRLNRFVDGRVAISNPAADYAREFYPGSYAIIPCGIDTARFNPEVGKIGSFSDGKVNLLFAGRLDARKNVLGMLEVYARLKANHPDTRLIIVGDGPQRADAHAFCENRNLRDVVFEGIVAADDLPKYYNSCDIFCAPTIRRESFGVVLVEAMACGKPTTGYRNRGYHSVVEGSPLSSFLAEPMDVSGLYRVLEELILDETLRRRMGEEGLKLVREKYSWKIVSGQLLDFYRELHT